MYLYFLFLSLERQRDRKKNTYAYSLAFVFMLYIILFRTCDAKLVGISILSRHQDEKLGGYKRGTK